MEPMGRGGVHMAIPTLVVTAVTQGYTGRAWLRTGSALAPQNSLKKGLNYHTTDTLNPKTHITVLRRFRPPQPDKLNFFLVVLGLETSGQFHWRLDLATTSIP